MPPAPLDHGAPPAPPVVRTAPAPLVARRSPASTAPAGAPDVAPVPLSPRRHRSASPPPAVGHHTEAMPAPARPDGIIDHAPPSAATPVPEPGGADGLGVGEDRSAVDAPDEAAPGDGEASAGGRRNPLAGRAVLVAWVMAAGTGLVSVAFGAALVALELLVRASPEDTTAAFDQWERVDGMAAGAFFASTVPWLAAFTVLAAWMYQEAGHRVVGEGQPRRWSAPWAVAAWFVPVVNLVVPRLVMAELERRRGDGARLWVGGHLWWIAWLTGGACLLAGLALSGTDRIATLRTSYALLIGGFALVAAGWGLLGLLVRRIDRTGAPAPAVTGDEHRTARARAGSATA